MTSTAVKQLITILRTLHDWNDKYNKGDKLVMTINDDYASVYNALPVAISQNTPVSTA